MTWDIKSKKIIHEAFVFKLEEMEVLIKNTQHTYTRILSRDWVNVLPITTEGQAIFVKQYRAGILDYTLEIPGGLIDEDERDPTIAAARELEEETGFHSMRLLPLTSINANPAIMNNKVHIFLALNCQKPVQRQHFPDKNEDIEIEFKDVKELDSLVRTGRIDHSLSALAIMLAQKYLASS